MKKLTTILILLIGVQFAKSQTIETLIEREILYEHFSGCIQVSDNGQIIYERCAGYADRQNGQLNQKDVPFDIGSVSKQFTAALILHLVKQGKVDLHVPINRYLGKYASDEWKNVTTHHLLTHTGGIPSLYQSGQGIAHVMPQADAISLDKLIGYFQHVEVLFDPGEEYRYSNSGYVLLAAIIESVTGSSYGAAIQGLAKTYGLHHTTFGAPESFARPYYGYRSDLEKEGVLFHKIWAIGAGGIYSTVGDLTMWVAIISSDQFLTPELRELYFHKHTKRGGGKYYAYGWDLMPESGIVSHDGMNFGYVSYLGFKPDQNLAVSILTNQSHESIILTGASAEYINQIQQKVWSILEGKSVEVLPEPTGSMEGTGTYLFDDGYRVKIARMAEHYVISGGGDYSPTRKLFQHAITGTDQKSDALKTVARAIKNDKFWGMGAVCDGQMKLAIYTGLFSWGFGQVTEDMGGILDAVAYQVGEQFGLIRVYGKKEILDVIVYFNAENEVQGVFEHGNYTNSDRMEYVAFATDEGQLFLDGFPYGEFSANIFIDEDLLRFEQEGRAFEARRIKVK